MVKVIEKIKSYIIHIADPVQIILFGSMASETNNIHSDIDLLVVTKSKILNSSYLANQIKSFIREAAFSADVIVIDQRYRDVARKESTTFIGNIIRTGKILYEKV